jgi:NADH:ubiquinone oxidoreductase subunit 2 (subunit N)
MSSPIIWVIFPFATGLLLLILRRFEPFTHFISIVFTLLLAYLAWSLPLNESITLIPLPQVPSIRIDETLFFFGRRFILDDSARPALILIYLGISLWFGGAYLARVNQYFIPLGLWIAALLTASLAVEPFLYAAIMILGVALLCVPILNPPGKPVSGGVMRFLKFQTIGMPIILIGGRLLSDVEINPTDVQFALRVTLIIGLGFAFITAIFPFHTWIPMVAESSHPYASAFVFFLFPATVSLLSVNYIEGYRTIGIPVKAGEVFRFIGVIMILTGGFMAVFERHLARIMGFAAIYEIGMALLALSLVADTQLISSSIGLYFAQQVPRALGLATWALGLCFLLRRTGDLKLTSVRGFARKWPIISTSLVLSTFTIAGLPVLAGFPVNIALWTNLVHIAPLVVLLGLLGTTGLLAAGIRTMAILAQNTKSDQDWKVNESIPEIIFLTGGWLMLIVTGLLPQLFIPILTNMAIIHMTPVK